MSSSSAAPSEQVRLAQLQAAFPNSDAEFRLTCLEEGFTLEQAHEYAAGEIEARPEIIANAAARYAGQQEAGTATCPGPISAVNAALKQRGREPLTAMETRRLYADESVPTNPQEREWWYAWRNDADLRESYDGNLKTYLAYCRAQAEGRVCIHGQ